MGGLDVGVSLNQSAVNASAKLLPDLEFRHPLWWDLHRRAGLGIAARARLTMADAKAPEAAEFNFLAAHKRLGHRRPRYTARAAEDNRSTLIADIPFPALETSQPSGARAKSGRSESVQGS